MKEFVFDPRMLISPPFTKCPKCQQMMFGILSIRNNHYDKRCKSCMYPDPHKNELSYSISLPEIKKRVIYLDQMVMSNMMKAINPKTSAYSKIDKIWLQLFELLDKLCKMQLIICPYSDFHQKESSLSPYFKSIKKMYDLLSAGIKFKNDFKLKMHQVILSLELFLQGKTFVQDILTQDLAFDENINVWQDRIFLTFEFDFTDEQLDEARKNRDEISDEFNTMLFEKWKISNKTFQDFFEIEENAASQIVIDGYVDFLKKKSSNSEQVKLENLFESIFSLSPNILLFNSIHSQISKTIKDPLVSLKTTIDFINSENFRSIPEIRISAYMFAGIARKATQGQKRPPSKGMLNDINVISNYLPFCDAMFLDNECVSLLTENPTGNYIKNFKVKLYSKNSIADFIEYLIEIERGTTSMHINKVKEVYGDDWIKPYTTLYETKES